MEKYKFCKGLPTYWVVKKPHNNNEVEFQLFKLTVIKYLSDVYEVNWGGGSAKYYGLDGNIYYSGTNCYDDYEDFANNPIILTLQEFINIIKPNILTPENNVIPEYWRIERNMENYMMVNTWAINQVPHEMFNNAYGFIYHSPNSTTTLNEKGRDYVEISTEYFKKYIFKSYEQVKNKPMESTEKNPIKIFKNRFGVESKYPELLLAFKSYCEKIEWKYDESFTPWSKLPTYNVLFFAGGIPSKANNSLLKPQHFSLSRSSDVINLDENWNEAIKLATETIHIPTVEEYDEALKTIEMFLKYNNQ